MNMAHLTACQSTNKCDKRRRTIEVSATMLRDILIGQDGPKSGTHLSLNDTNSCEILSSPHVDKTRLKNRARSEDAKVKKGRNNSTNQNSTSSNDGISLSRNAASTGLRYINDTNEPNMTLNYTPPDPLHFKIGHRYSPRQGSAGSDASNKSQSEDSVGSVESTSSPDTCENLSDREINQLHNSNPNAIGTAAPLSLKSPRSMDPPMLTSSPLLERKDRCPKTNLINKKAPYYVGDTRLSYSGRSVEPSHKASDFPEQIGTHLYHHGPKTIQNTSNSNIPYEEVFSDISKQISSDPQLRATHELASLQALKQMGCQQDQPFLDESILYDDSMYRLLPNTELAKACPNPIYDPDDFNSNIPSHPYDFNIGSIRNYENIPDEPQALSLSMHHESQNGQRIKNISGGHIGHHNTTKITHEPREILERHPNPEACLCGMSSCGYENAILGSPTVVRDDNRSTTTNDNALFDESGKSIRENFQQRMLAYHPTQMQSLHRGRNDDELQSFAAGMEHITNI